MQSLTVYPKFTDLLTYSRIVKITQTVFDNSSLTSDYKNLGKLYPYLLDKSKNNYGPKKSINKVVNTYDLFTKGDCLYINPEFIEVKWSSIHMGTSFLEKMYNSEEDCHDELDYFIFINQISICYSIVVGRSDFGKVISRIITLALAIYTRGLIDIDGSDLEDENLIMHTEEFAFKFCGIDDYTSLEKKIRDM